MCLNLTRYEQPQTGNLTTTLQESSTTRPSHAAHLPGELPAQPPTLSPPAHEGGGYALHLWKDRTSFQDFILNPKPKNQNSQEGCRTLSQG